MDKLVTRQEEELQTLKRFVENKNESFSSKLVSYSYPEPCDVAYAEVQYQITYGDQKRVSEIRKTISKGETYFAIRGIDESNKPEVVIKQALTGKVTKSSPSVVLLIDCTYSTTLTPPGVEVSFKQYADENAALKGQWLDIYAVFPKINIRLM